MPTTYCLCFDFEAVLHLICNSVIDILLFNSIISCYPFLLLSTSQYQLFRKRKRTVNACGSTQHFEIFVANINPLFIVIDRHAAGGVLAQIISQGVLMVSFSSQVFFLSGL